jgi:hypothetical protein
MIWRKIQNLSFVKLGALNGLILGLLNTLFLASICLIEVFDQQKRDIDYHSQSFCTTIANWWVLPEAFFIVVVASFLVQKLFANRIKSTILVWQIIGLVSAVECFFYGSFISFIKTWYMCNSKDSQCDASQLHFLSDFIFAEYQLRNAVIYLFVFAVFNLFFSLILRQRKPALP